PVAKVFRSGYKELQKLSLTERNGGTFQEVDNVNRALVRASMHEMSNMEKYLSWLATTASASPFVGLFGTVWGIMNSFQRIGTAETVNLAVVAPGISEALIATAVGLAAAIPAVIAYNHFVNHVKKIGVDVDNFSNDFLNIIQRGLMAGGKTPAKR
ncbi:MAG: MotA/TolQ/ExbB proton channel family protein, partial [Bacteriovoracia bacterium]